MFSDAIHDETLARFADLGIGACREFSRTRVAQLKRRLSFFRNGPVVQEPWAYERDRLLLDKLFACRMEGTLQLLLQELAKLPKGRRPALMLIGEASANGLLEFDARGRPEPDQPYLLVERRMLDEVKRSFDFYRSRRELFSEGLMFFQDTYDRSIDLCILGAQGAPSVLRWIYRHSGRSSSPEPPPSGDRRRNRKVRTCRPDFSRAKPDRSVARG